MAIRDLLWACPACRQPRSLRKQGRADVCSQCGTRFARGRADRIVATRRDGTTEVRPAADWLDRIGTPPVADRAAGPERILFRTVATPFLPVRYRGELIGWVERYGPDRPASIRLVQDRVDITPDHDGPMILRIEDFRVVQPSSTRLQLATRDTVVSIRFLESSVLHWESLLQEAVRHRWRALGRGEVCDFQPRIVAR